MYWSKITASTALAAAALAACGVERAADNPIQPAAADAAPALTPPEAPPAVITAAQTETTPQATPREPAHGPTIPAAQLREEILDLSDSVKSPEDMSRANVENDDGRAFAAESNIDGLLAA